MKRTINTLILTAGIAALLTAACNTKKGDETVSTADSTATPPIAAVDTQNVWKQDWEKFKSDAQVQIQKNDDSISAFNVRIQQGNSKLKAKYEKRVAELKAKNEEMKAKLNDFKEDSKEKWEQFKLDFNNAMDSLDQKIKRLDEKA